ncbi:TIGR03086 family protein [Streptomyces sp. NPDC001307]|uniref:TIGR03086 family protein n=1 Tax=Streptomyces sp. NPDC001307 TaxID=3364560 RepID=UPI0036ACCF6B
MGMVRQAHACLREVVAAVPEEEWGRPTPCSERTVRQVLNRARIDQQAYGLALRAGRSGEDPFRPADALHDDPVAEPDKVLDAVADAYAGLPADAGSLPTPLGPLPLPPAAGRRCGRAGRRRARLGHRRRHRSDPATRTGADGGPAAGRGSAGATAARVRRVRARPRVRRPPGQGGDLLAFLGRDPERAPPTA